MKIGALAALAVLAQRPAPAPAFEVVRLGDNQMSCEALVGEINALHGEMARLQAEVADRAMAMNSGLGAGGAAQSLGGLAAGLVPGADILMSTAGALAASREQERMMQDVAAMNATAGLMGPLSGRIEHLSQISRDKRC